MNNELLDKNYERWSNWQLLEHGPLIERYLMAEWERYNVNRGKFRSDRFYLGCGHDAGKKKYDGWDLCDLREVEGSILWDVLMGFPYADSSLVEVKTKLSIGMFTWHQVRFILHEAARCLKIDGVLDVTFRDFDRLLARRDELKADLFNRYIYGSGLYYGSRRRSCWTIDTLTAVAEKYHLTLVSTDYRGMNSTVTFGRTEGKLRAYGPEPKVHRNEDGSMHNDGGEWDHFQ